LNQWIFNPLSTSFSHAARQSNIQRNFLEATSWRNKKSTTAEPRCKTFRLLWTVACASLKRLVFLAAAPFLCDGVVLWRRHANASYFENAGIIVPVDSMRNRLCIFEYNCDIAAQYDP
jgi:hypothetical protein